ncbi:MAG: ABC transporter ATP-binding protein [Haloferacaceae archaeon]
MARLTLDGVRKRFDEEDRPAVDDLSLSVRDGEFLVVVGPSGSGKTTLLRLVAGVEDLDAGSIRLDGVDIDHLAPKDRDVTMVFQNYALYPSMTVRENLAFGLEQSTEVPPDEIGERLRWAADMLGLGGLLDRTPDGLSGGEQQRVALGRAVVRDPSVFLMDEPLSNLDARLSDEMRTEIARIQAELGTTTLYVTHDQTEAMSMGDRIAVLRAGRVQQVGTPQECYGTPVNRFVAGFLGEPAMNFVECERRDDALVAGDLAFPLSSDQRAAVGSATRVTLGVRPPDLDLVAAAEGDVAATVETTEPTGRRTTVNLDPGGAVSTDVPAERDGGRAPLVATVTGPAGVGRGERVGVRIPQDAVHLFDGGSGEALYNPT